MKLTTFILIIALAQVSAKGFGQKITLNETNAPIERILQAIKDQSGYVFFYDVNDLQNQKISIKLNNASIEEVLKSVVKDVPLTYKIVKNNIVLTKKTPPFLDRLADLWAAIDVRGRVVDETGKPLPGAVIKVKGTGITLITNNDGEFVIRDVKFKTVLQISFIGYRPKEYTILGAESYVSITMELSDNKLAEVSIVSTGYQTLPKERATGSFELIDNKLYNRNSGTNIINRLEAITNSIVFNRYVGRPTIYSDDAQRFTIRGNSNLNGGARPLIVVDNFPYEGNIESLNPNDIESMTILKDAAAASLWGARASNGVLVITTKKGKFDQPLNISINSNLTSGDKPDLFKIKRMTSSEYIDVEKFLFDNGYFNSKLNDTRSYPNISPVVELLDFARKNPSMAPETIAKIDALRAVDSRNDISKYLYRQAVFQQYAMDISGGSKQASYIVSGGYDKNLNNLVTSSFDRITTRANITLRPLKNLEVNSGLFYGENNSKEIGDESKIAYGTVGTFNWPYIQLADAEGNPLAVDNISKRASFRNSAGNGRLLDWTYKPLAELNSSSKVGKRQQVLLNVGADYKISPAFTGSIKYQYERALLDTRNWQGIGSFYMRDLINQFTQWNPTNTTAPVIRPIPVGDQIIDEYYNLRGYNLRGQLNADKIWGKKHELHALAGAEIRQDRNTFQNTGRIYGYNDETQTSKLVNYDIAYPVNFSPGRPNGFGSQRIPLSAAFSDVTNRYTSYFANAAYTYDHRFTISASTRTDASNLFGVKANRRSQPLWSTGLMWNVSNERFYKSDWLPSLKLRLTYGYNGNSSTAAMTSALSVIQYASSPDGVTQQIFADVLNAPNPGLSAEKTATLNLGIEFGSKNNRLSGNVEYFDKRSRDLIYNAKVDPSTGFQYLNTNSAELHGNGVEVTLNSRNLVIGNFSWTSNLLFNYNKLVLSKYSGPIIPPRQFPFETGGGIRIIPIEGNDPYGIYTLKWAGLDPANGDPRGYVNGVINKDYSALVNPTSMDDIEYHGSGRPKYYGSFRNTFTWKGFSVSANIQYKLGYNFQRDGLSYNSLFSLVDTKAEFSQRWQKPGDELITNVPSMVYPLREFGVGDEFYRKSSAVIEKADHIRLRDITLDYTFNKPTRYFKNIRVYANINNLGLLWKATKYHVDPELLETKVLSYSKTYAIGFSANF